MFVSSWIFVWFLAQSKINRARLLMDGTEFRWTRE